METCAGSRHAQFNLLLFHSLLFHFPPSCSCCSYDPDAFIGQDSGPLTTVSLPLPSTSHRRYGVDAFMTLKRLEDAEWEESRAELQTGALHAGVVSGLPELHDTHPAVLHAAHAVHAAAPPQRQAYVAGGGHHAVPLQHGQHGQHAQHEEQVGPYPHHAHPRHSQQHHHEQQHSHAQQYEQQQQHG